MTPEDEDRLLHFIQVHRRANWYSLRHHDWQRYGMPGDALRALAVKRLIEQDPHSAAGVYTLTSEGIRRVQAREERLATMLRHLERPRLDVNTTHNLIRELGDEQYRAARPVIEHFLTHPDHALHRAALHVLVGEWCLGDETYLAASKRLFTDDLEPVCRLAGVRFLARGTRFMEQAAPESLSVLAHVTQNPQEERELRLAAYQGMRTILKGKSVQELAKLPEISSLDDIDCAVVESYVLGEM